MKIEKVTGIVLSDTNYSESSKILNVLTNAAKYTDKGKITFSVQSVIKDNVCRMIISVEDTGRGIKKESIDKLFNKFERLDEDRNTTIEGTGLGLAITKKLLEMMHGKIVVQSVYGKGSKFTISLDQRIVKNPSIKLDEVKTNDIEIINLSSKKVLVVDDNKLNIKVASRLLSPYKVEIVPAESGFEAIEILKEDKDDEDFLTKWNLLNELVGERNNIVETNDGKERLIKEEIIERNFKNNQKYKNFINHYYRDLIKYDYVIYLIYYIYLANNKDSEIYKEFNKPSIISSACNHLYYLNDFVKEYSCEEMYIKVDALKEVVRKKLEELEN